MEYLTLNGLKLLLLFSWDEISYVEWLKLLQLPRRDCMSYFEGFEAASAFQWRWISYVGWFEAAPAFQLKCNILRWMVWSCSCFSVEKEYLTLNGLKLLLLFSWDGISYVEWFEAAPASPSHFCVLIRRVWSCSCFSVEIEYLTLNGLKLLLLFSWNGIIYVEWFEAAPAFQFRWISYVDRFEAAPAFKMRRKI